MVNHDQQSISNMGGNTFSDEELSVKEFWAIIIKRKWIIIGIFCLAILLSTAYLLSKRAIYQSDAKITIGEVNGIKLEDPNFLTSELMSQFGNIPVKAKEWAVLHSTVYDGNTNAMLLISYGTSPLETQKLLKKVMEYIIKRHDKLFDLKLKTSQDKLLHLQDQLKLLDLQLATFEKQRINYFKENSALGIMFAMEEMRLEDLHPTLEQNIVDLSLSLTDLYTQRTKVLEQPVSFNSPVEPKYKVYLVMGGLLGLFAGLLAAFFLEFFQRGLFGKRKVS